ncbi:MAG: hypothetical protein MJZ21_04250 [archaeon]|nr:hypothetical protein [archaeon]
MDRKGAMGFPMRLTLAFILIALCIPSLSGMAAGFEEKTLESETDAQVGILLSAAGRTYYGGAGSSENVSLTIPAGFEISVGGEGTDAYSVCIYNNEGVVKTVYTDHPSIRFLGERIVLSGPCEVRLSCNDVSGTYGVQVGVA